MDGICDCHMHVFGPPGRYPGGPNRSYTPTEKGLDDYQRIAAQAGIERVVIVQPSAYGTDNRCTLDALRQRGETTRAVVVVDPAVSDDDLTGMDRLGVRGIRLNAVTPGGATTDGLDRQVRTLAARIERLGWHVQLYADPDLLPQLAATVRESPVPVVFDHMGGARTARTTGDPGFRTLLRLLDDGRCWVKLSGADRVAGEDEDFTAAAPFAQALLASNPERLVWGSDWPHLDNHPAAAGEVAPPARYRNVSPTALLTALEGWAANPLTLHRILVDNPARLYRF
jgi:predicted TIM-barrel fold metal-dependent hydrolase